MKRLLNGVPVLILLLLLLPTTALAVEKPQEITVPYEIEFHSVDTQFPITTYAWGETSEAATWVDPGVSAWSNGVYEAYRAQLSAEEKGYYDTLKEGFATPGSKSVSFGEMEKTFTGVVSATYELNGNTWVGSNLTLSDEAQERIEQERVPFYAAFLALMKDHPELPWIHGSFGLRLGLSCSAPSKVVAGLNTYSATITVTFESFSVTDAPEQTTSVENIAQFNSNIASAIESIDAAVAADTESTGDYAILRAMSNYLSDLITYNFDGMSADYDQTAYSAFVNYPGGTDRPATNYPQTVCAGYTSAFKLLCDHYEIPCIYVSGLGNGGPHAWNYVRLDDGNWYAADITWNDGDAVGGVDSNKSLRFFLVGGSTNCDGKTYDGSHVNSGKWSDIPVVFPYPSLNTSGYIDSVSISGLTAPVRGAQPDTDAIVTTVPAEASVSGIVWKAASGAEVDGKFAPDTVYTATISFDSVKGYAPTSATTITLDGYDAEKYQVAITNEGIAITFAATDSERVTVELETLQEGTQVLLIHYSPEDRMEGIYTGVMNDVGEWEFPLRTLPQSGTVKLLILSEQYVPVKQAILL